MADYTSDTSLMTTDSSSDNITMTEAYTRGVEILRNVYIKLSDMPLGFNLPSYTDSIEDSFIWKKFSIDLKDTMRELKVTYDSIINIESGSYDEYMVEQRIMWHAIRRFRFSGSIFFKFSTAVDGKTVDKTQIPKILKEILDELDVEWKKYRSSTASTLWSQSSSVRMNTSGS